MPSADLREAEAGFGERLSQDAVFVSYVGTDAAEDPRIDDEYPSDVLSQPTEDEFPRSAFLRVDDDIERPGFGTVRLQVMHWALDKTTRNKMDARVLQLVDEQEWLHANGTTSTRLRGERLGGSRDSVERIGTLRLFRRTRDFRIAVS